MPLPSPVLAVFSQPRYRTVLLSNLVSRFGDSLDSVAFAWLVYQLTGSTLLMGALLAVNALPNILFAPVTGVIADRFRKKPLVVGCHLGRGAVVTLTALLFLGGRLEVWHLFVLTFLNSSLESLETPAAGALTVHLLDKSLLVEAGGVSATLTTLVQMAGLGLAGLIIGAVGIGGAVALDGLTFFLAAAGTALVRIPTDTRTPGKLTLGQGRADFVEGMRFIFGHRTLAVVLFLAMFANLAFTPLNVLEAPYVKDVLGGGPAALSALGLGLAAGMALGGLAVGAVCRRFGTWPTVFGGFWGLGGACALVGLPGLVSLPFPALAGAVGAYFLAGLLLPLVSSPLGAWLSGRVPEALQGRVFAAFNALCLMAVPLGSAGAGALAAVVPVPVLLTATGALVVVVTLGARWALGRDDGAAETPAPVETAPGT